MTKTYSFKRKGFTLVELIIVIVIMITLAGGVFLVSGDSGNAQKANQIISRTRTLKTASIMYKRDHLTIPNGTEIGVLEPYLGSPVNNIEGVTYSFAFGENGETYLNVDLSGIDDNIRADISEMAEENLFFQPSEEVSEVKENSELVAYLSPSSILGYFAAKPAYAKNNNNSDNGNCNGNNSSNGNAYGQDPKWNDIMKSVENILEKDLYKEYQNTMKNYFNKEAEIEDQNEIMAYIESFSTDQNNIEGLLALFGIEDQFDDDGDDDDNGTGSSQDEEEHDGTTGSVDDQSDFNNTDQGQNNGGNEEETPKDTGNNSDGSSGNSSNSVKVGGSYSGGNTILVRI